MSRIDRGSALIVGLVAVTLLLGLLSGIAIDRWALHPSRRAMTMRRGPDFGFGAGVPFDAAKVRSRVASQLARELGLTPDQQTRVDSLIRRQQRAAGEIARSVRPRLDSVTAQADTGMRQILTPEQFRRLTEMRKARGRGR